MTATRKFRIRFTSALDDHSTPHVEDLTFTDEQIVLLERFRDGVRDLSRRRVFNEFAPTHYNVSYDQMGLRFSAPQIDDEAWDAMMLRLRPLTLEQGSPHRFDLVRNMIGRQFATDAAKAHFKTIKDGYQGKFTPMVFSRAPANETGEWPKIGPKGILENGQGPAAFLEKWMNGLAFHQGNEQRAYLEEMFRVVPRDFVQGIVYMHIREMLTAMLHLTVIIEGILKSEVRALEADIQKQSTLDPPITERAPRPFGVARHWPEILESDLLARMDESDLKWAEGVYTDEFGVMKRPRRAPRKARTKKRPSA